MRDIAWRNKDGLISGHSPTHPLYMLADRQELTYDSSVWTGCYLENLPGALDDRDEWKERGREIRASSAT